MIRRNHIESVSKMEHKYLTRGRGFIEQNPDRFNRYDTKKDSELQIDENYKPASSGKKYYQYKDWRSNGQATQGKQEVKEVKRNKDILTEFSSNDIKTMDKYKKDQQCQLEKMFHKEYLNENKEFNKKRIAQDSDNLTYKYLKDNQKESFNEKPYEYTKRESLLSERASFEYPCADSPPRLRTSFQSTRKYSSNVNQENLSSLRNGYQSLSGTKKMTPMFNPIRQASDFDSRTPYQKQTLTKQPLSRPYDYSSLREQPLQRSQPYTISEKYNPHRAINEPCYRQKNYSNNLPLRDQRSGDERVSQKLKMISTFNSQINQRIKSIISSFEQLKSKI